MKFKIERQSWVCGQYEILPGTVIDANSQDQWTNIVRGKIPPPSITLCLDEEAYNLLKRTYPTEHIWRDYFVEMKT